MSVAQQVAIALPDWVDGFVTRWLNQPGMRLDTPQQRMSLAIALSANNVQAGSGGPFGAVVVEESSGRLVGVGVNLVTSLCLSCAHAEMVALSLAQRAVSNWNLGASGRMQLVTSCEPCAMCFGAIPWSGVTSIVCGAHQADAEAAGFDEGEKPHDWARALQRRGIEVTLDVMRQQAARVLLDYARDAGTIYNP